MQRQKHSSEAVPKKAVHTAANYGKKTKVDPINSNVVGHRRSLYSLVCARDTAPKNKQEEER